MVQATSRWRGCSGGDERHPELGEERSRALGWVLT